MRSNLSIQAIAHSQHLMSKFMPQVLGSNSALKLSEEQSCCTKLNNRYLCLYGY
ncbi:hypothetical protein [Chlorogloeopsis sp. ULAP02]|uniref:hypothetical protein n=1 Tax=Chlorogloeopsis sp. ULAP02 TaxID=3107926 RepID=UPI003136D595